MSDKEKIEYFQSKKIRVDYSGVEGIGVFATEDIVVGELIERCPMIGLSYRSRYHHDPQLYKYLYTQPLCPCSECKNHGFNFFMVLGYGMLYNHQDTPNTQWMFNYNKKIGDVVAIRPIKKDEEIFVTYGEAYFKGKNKITINNESKE